MSVIAKLPSSSRSIMHLKVGLTVCALWQTHMTFGAVAGMQFDTIIRLADKGVNSAFDLTTFTGC